MRTPRIYFQLIVMFGSTAWAMALVNMRPWIVFSTDVQAESRFIRR